MWTNETPVNLTGIRPKSLCVAFKRLIKKLHVWIKSTWSSVTLPYLHKMAQNHSFILYIVVAGEVIFQIYSSHLQVSQYWKNNVVSFNRFSLTPVNTLNFLGRFPGQGLNLSLLTILRCLDQKQLALTYPKIYQCECFVSRCISVVFFVKNVFKHNLKFN